MTREDIFKLLNKHQDNDTLDIKTAKEMVNIIFDGHEAQLRAKDEQYKLIVNDVYMKEIKRLKNEVAFWKEDDADRERLGIIIDCLTSDCNKKDAEIAKLKEKYEAKNSK